MGFLKDCIWQYVWAAICDQKGKEGENMRKIKKRKF